MEVYLKGLQMAMKPSGHGKQNIRLYDRKSMNKIGLREADPVANLSVIQPQDAQNFGHPGQCHSLVGGCHHS